ncbi:cytochrome P450 2J2 isoform X2 [Sarcophilus harrisii]|uniref:cytochrome P450 2J2 isoform X2 n=1 Tax=Sarcophilus harrisii TaxID=9305 RepID=UPI001301C139|nr:cytochrome P450 2J2 isoform X2 [Sarcophilus harrisii]
MQLSLRNMLPSLWEEASLQTLLLLSAIILILAHYLKSRRRHLNYPPSPPGLPILGNFFHINYNDPQANIQKLAKQYGNVFITRAGTLIFMMVTGLPMIKEVLLNQDEAFIDRPQFALLVHVFKSFGLTLSNGQAWKQQRRFALMTLRNFGLGKKTLEDRIREEAMFLIEAIREEKGQPFDPHFQINNAVSNIICSVTFGHRFEYHDSQFRELLKSLDDITVLETRWECRDNIHYSFSEKNLVFCTLDLFFAGTETTSTTLRWALLYMALYPEIQGKIQEEIDRVIGQSRQPTMADKENMPYTNAAVHEVQRMGDILPFNVPRMAAFDTTLAGYHVPKGTIVLINLTALHRDPKEWATPETFNPEHFLENGQFKKRESFLPFSMGKRVCLGEQLARAELFIFFTSLLQKFTVQPPPNTQLSLDFRFGLTISPVPYKICAIPREM